MPWAWVATQIGSGGSAQAMSSDSCGVAARAATSMIDPRLDAPLVTIGMPAYNGASHLEEGIRSLLRQTEPRFILHVSDDASTDETWRICQELAAEDPRIHCERHIVNRGSVENFAYLLRSAQTL